MVVYSVSCQMLCAISDRLLEVAGEALRPAEKPVLRVLAAKAVY